MQLTKQKRLPFLNFCHVVFYIGDTESQHAATQTILYQAGATRAIC